MKLRLFFINLYLLFKNLLLILRKLFVDNMQKKNILIADAGSTKVDWVLISGSGDVISKYTSDGLNALLAEIEDVEKSLSDVKEKLGDVSPLGEIHYYGAGCATPRICDKMKEAINNTWPCSSIFVNSDLLGAARSLFADREGIACILGTGSNSCLYNGKEIAKNVPSLGYILGDEGSGSALGKRLVADAFKEQLPDNVRSKFLDNYRLSLQEILDNVYRSQAPNKFFASLVPFISQNIWNPYIYELVHREFTTFFKRNVAMYPGAHQLKVGFIGGIAFNFEKILREAASEIGYSVADVKQSPIAGLIEFHKNNSFGNE